MACKDCIGRRSFLATAAVGAVAVLAGCGDGSGSLGVLPTEPVSIAVGDHPNLATLGRLVQVPNLSIAVKRTGATTFEALSMVCTHQGCETDIVSNAFTCACHGSRFANDGRVLAGPANSPLGRFPTSYDPATDTLTIG